ncbi:MAG TPA: outer membrane protein assembly factor BamA [Alphaproteobacteria bacterium]|nr:outer membrane protein assembly factor BamA [Alphaproteobacteria bacterium]
MAQDQPSVVGGGTIEAIRIEGNERIEQETVLSYFGIRPGDPFNPELIDSGLKKLFATGLFRDVTIRREDGTLVVSLVENPIINRIAFEGNRRIDDEDLSAELQLRPRVVFTQTRVQNDVQRILDIYRRSGRFAATVEPKIIQLEQNRVDLVFEIDEGPLTGVKAIDFIGNKAFSDGDLRDVITTTESAWWRFLSTSDNYDPDRLAADQDLLRRFYLTEGYADFRILSAVAELSPEGDGFVVTITLEEGDRYRFGEMTVETSLKNLDPEALQEQITTEPGDWYDGSEVDRTVGKLTDVVGELGYAFVDVRPRPNIDREQDTIGIAYEIREGPRVYVERIDIRGNVRTRDKVIRREFRVVEGDAFNTSKIRRSRQRVENLGFFSRVDVQTAQGTAPDQTTIAVDVQEQSTGELSLGAGFSTTEGPFGDISLRERNLLGNGQDLRLGFRLSSRRSRLDLSFTEPYFMDRDIAAGFDVFRIATDFSSESSFEQESVGGSLRGAFEVTENLRQTVRYTLRRDDIHDVDDDASVVIRDEEGVTYRSIIGNEYFYDRLDSRINPSDGYFARLANDLAGLGGDARFLRTTMSGGYYMPVTDSLIASVRSEVGYIFGISDDVRVSDRYFLGGDSFRGFAARGVGPRDTASDDSLGGNFLYSGTAELTFPLGLPEELPVRGRVFSDFGAVTGLDDDGPTVEDTASPRVSVGTGLTWRSPIGPIALDFAIPVLKEDFDEEERFRFSFGTRF